MVNPEILLCSDLDRTLLPNGREPESPQARPLLRALAAQPALRIAYVSGRDRRLLVQAIRQYALPLPDFAIGDVGTTIYRLNGDEWQIREDWSREIAEDWQGQGQPELARLFSGLPDLLPQEDEKQSRYKLSYYLPPDRDHRATLEEMGRRLEAEGIRANLVWSIDEMKQVGLLDVLPARANKLHAIRFLMDREGFADTQTVFCGDSGNDLAVLTSGLQSVLVANAAEDVRREAVEGVTVRGCPQRLYLAGGAFLGMNGNYCAGALEGLAHFFPETRDWMTAAL